MENIDKIIEDFQNALEQDFPRNSGEALDSILRDIYPEPDSRDLGYDIYMWYLIAEVYELEKKGKKDLAAVHRRCFDELLFAGILPSKPPEDD